jgi:hypothetical protein
MKKYLFISIIQVFLFLCSKSHSQSKIVEIYNLTDGQTVNGYITAKLQLDTTKNYRYASYYMGEEFISNVFEYPYSLEFDTRDFKNGNHVLSVRVLSDMSMIEMDKVNITINNEQNPNNFIIKDIRRYAASHQIPYRGSYIDAPHSILKKNEKEFYIVHNTGLMKFVREKQGITTFSSGTLENPFTSLEWNGYVVDVWDKNGHDVQGIWLMSIYKLGENELLGFTHNESCYNEDEPCTEDAKSFSLGLGYSNDNGKSWLFLGEILRHYQYNEHPENNMGGVPYIVNGDFFQVFFQEYAENDKPYTGTARANKQQVIEAARHGKTTSWNKYRNNKWDEPGITGLSDNVLGNINIDFNMHCKATYVNSINKFLIATYDRRNPDLYLLTSSDGINWEIAEKIRDHNTDFPVRYPFIGDLFTDDCHQVDNSFKVYWSRNNHEIWGASVFVQKN